MHRLALLATLPLLSSCGAGVVIGVAGNRRTTPPPASTITIDQPYTAFFGQENEIRRLTIASYQAPAAGRLRVTLRIPDLPDRSDPQNVKPYLDVEQHNETIEEVRGSVTRALFTLATLGIADAVVREGRDLTAQDLAAHLLVRVDDREVAPAIPFTIHKQPRATLIPSRVGSSEELLSAAGGSTVTCRLSGHVSQSAGGLAIVFATTDPGGGETPVLQDLAVQVESQGTDGLVLRAVAPPHTFACRVFASVRDVVAGLSTPIEMLFYRPDIGTAVPRVASSDIGTRMLAVGTGLLPLRFTEPEQPGEPDYDAIELFVEKGGRRAQVLPGLIQRRPASLSRLVFEVPPSPDGRTGPADVIIAVTVGQSRFETLAPDLFAYGDPTPSFGPRGVTLPTPPRHSAMGDFEGDGGGLDLVACSGTLPNVHLFLGSDNGMLRRFGAPLIAGSASEPLERFPQRLVVEDLDRNGVSDVLVLNRGTDVTATHTLLLGQMPPAAPLRVAGAALRSATSAAQFAKGDVDGNGMVDLVVLPPLASQLPPELCLSFGGVGGPHLVTSPISQVADAFDVVQLDDLDEDGVLDLVLARGGADVAVQTLYGRGDGTFVPGQTLNLTAQIPGYVADDSSRAVGVFACGDGRSRGLALVLEGRPSVLTPALVTVLDRTGPRQYGLPLPVRTLRDDRGEKFKTWLAVDLDADGVRELIVSSHESSTRARLLVFAWRTVQGEPAFVELPGIVDLGADLVGAVHQLAFAPAGRGDGVTAGHALFVAHFAYQAQEDRVSTLLLQRQGGAYRFLPPDATLVLPHQVEGLALGRFRGASASPRSLDMAVASSGAGGGDLRGVQFFTNDGVGNLVAGPRTTKSLLPATLATLPLAGGDAVVCLDAARLLRVVRPVPPPNDVVSLLLDPYLPAGLEGAPLVAGSKLAVADVDQDGAADVVALLLFQGGSVSEEDAGQLLVLFGRSSAPVGELPFVLPNAAVVRTVSAHGSARDLAIEEFAVDPDAPKVLEVAVAVGGTANHVRFYRVDRPRDEPALRSLRRSFVSAQEPALSAGEGPELMATADVDGDGVVDLAVAAVSDRQLRFFTNTARAGVEVDPAAFRQIPSGVLSLPAGPLSQLALPDLNGDAVPDVLVTSLLASFPVTTHVQYHLGTGYGQFATAVVIPPFRTGADPWDREQRTVRLAIGEMNNDRSVDIVSGCQALGSGDRNVYLLFGGAR